MSSIAILILLAPLTLLAVAVLFAFEPVDHGLAKRATGAVRGLPVPPRILVYVALGIVALAVLIPATTLMFGFARTVLAWVDPAWLGTDTAEAPSTRLRSWLELAYFAAGIAVFVVAICALSIAARQAREAEQTRMAQVYLEVTHRFLSAPLEESRALSMQLKLLHGSYPQMRESLGDFVDGRVSRMLRSTEIADLLNYSNHLEIVKFFEHVGALVRQQYLREEDIRTLFRSAILDVETIYGSHIDRLRKSAGTDTFYENFSYLVARMKRGEDRPRAPDSA